MTPRRASSPPSTSSIQGGNAHMLLRLKDLRRTTFEG